MLLHSSLSDQGPIRPAPTEFRACIVPLCLLLNIPTEDEVGMIYGDQVIGKADYSVGWTMLHNRDGVKPKDVSPPDEMKCEGGVNIANDGSIAKGIAKRPARRNRFQRGW